jgi:glycosyltransferase 2 family protein
MICMKRWQFWLGLLISVVFLYIALKGLELGKVWQTVQQANLIWLAPAVTVYFMAVWVRAWRWHYLLKPLKSISTRSMFPIVTIGYFGNNVYPARAGEILRAIVLKKHHGVPISASLATIIVERVFDGVVMLTFVFFNLPELAKLTTDSGVVGNIQSLAFWGALAFLGVLLVFLLAAMFPKTTERIMERMLTWLPQKAADKIHPLALKFFQGLECLRSPKEALMIFLTSMLIWLLETGKYWFIMLAFPFRVSFFALMLMNGIVNLATTIPSAPGYVGTFDAPGIALLKAYQIPGDVAAGYTLLLHVALWLPITLLGAYFFTREGLKWGQKYEKSALEEEA